MARERKKSSKSATPPALPEAAGSDKGGVLPSGYVELLDDLKTRIRTAQVKASLAADRELILLYWNIGRELAQRQEQEGWGQKAVDRLAGDLQKEFPGLQGFSRANIYRMRAFSQAYQIVAQPVRQLTGFGPPDEVLGLPWGHNVLLFEKLKISETRLWYARQAVANG